MTPREQATLILERLPKIGDPTRSLAACLQQVGAAPEAMIQDARFRDIQ